MPKYHYLKHLAKQSTAYLHPHSEAATALLIDQLNLSKSFSVLEIGCGTGATLVQIAQKYSVQLSGVDVLPEMLQSAQSRIKSAELSEQIQLKQITPMEPLPFPESTFERIYAESVFGIQDAPNANFMLAEVYRLLKPNGRFFMNDAIWRVGTSAEIIQKINQGCEKDFGLRQASAQPWDVQDWSKMIERSGLRVESSELISDLFAKYPQEKPRVIKKQKIWAKLSPTNIKYRYLLHKHRNDGQHIEARLFCMVK